MGKWIFAILSIGLVYGAFLTGCQPAKVNSTSFAQDVSQTQVSKEAGAELPISHERKMTATIVRTLFYGHQIFSESWRLLVGSGGMLPSSAMKVVGQKLQDHLGQGQSLIMETKMCPEDHQILEIAPSGSSQVFDFKISQLNCASGIKSEIAVIHWDETRGPGFRMVVHPAMIPEGVGDSLALLNRDITCDFTLGNQERLIHLQCANLGQGLDRASHIAFSKFEYGRDQKDLLVVEADRYRNLLEKISCQSTEPCLKLTVPLEGRIKVIQNNKTDQVEKKTTGEISDKTPKKIESKTESKSEDQIQVQAQEGDASEQLELDGRQRGPQLLPPGDTGEDLQPAESTR